jgi:hypothetical protein
MKNTNEVELPLKAEEQCLRVKENFKLSKTTLTHLESADVCPVKWKSQWLERRWKFEAGDAMLKGMYFEYLAIGGGVGDEDVTDLERLKNGKKSTDQMRIEEQAQVFKDALFNTDSSTYLGFKVIDTQVEVENEYSKGVIDVVAEKDGKPCLIDVKLTRDFYQVKPPYGYGYMDQMDMIQMMLYKKLYDEEHGTDVDIYIFVADFSPKMNRKLVKIHVSDKKMAEVQERLDTGYEVIDLYQEKGWTYDPSERECKECPLECEHRYVKETVPLEDLYI